MHLKGWCFFFFFRSQEKRTGTKHLHVVTCTTQTHTSNGSRKLSHSFPFLILTWKITQCWKRVSSRHRYRGTIGVIEWISAQSSLAQLPKTHPKNTMVHVVGLLPTDHKYFGSNFSCGHTQSALTEFKEAFIN